MGANVVALLLGLAATAGIIAAYGRPVGEGLQALWDGALGDAFAVGNTLNKAAPLLFVALAFIVAQRAGLVSIGGEGQLHIGGLTAVAAAIALGDLPVPLGLVLAVLAGAVGGGLWGALAGWLRTRFSVNEVIATLLLNYIAIEIVALMVTEESLLREDAVGSTALPQSPLVPASVRLPRLLPDTASRAQFGVVLAVVAAVAVWVLIHRTVRGFRIRMTGLNPAMAARSGTRVAALVIGVMFLSGALGGLAGTSMLLGEQYRVQSGFSPGYGFDGIAVALLARNSPLGAIAAALLFGGLRAGGLRLEATLQVPQALVLVVQGVIILAVAGTAWFVQRRRRIDEGARSEAEPEPEAAGAPGLDAPRAAAAV